MTARFRNPGYDPPGFAEHMAMHQQHMDYPIDITWGNDRIESCTVCDPRIAHQCYVWNKQVERDEIEAPLLARIAELETQLGVKP